MDVIKGVARVDKRTKDLVKRLQPNEIAVINHEELDEVAAESLVATKIKGVINASESISRRYPNLGPLVLAEAGVHIIDNVGQDILTQINEGDEIEIYYNLIVKNGQNIGQGEVLTVDKINSEMAKTKKNLGTVLEKFVQNTLEYAQQEQWFILGGVNIPDTDIKFKERHTLIVVRGQNYKEDLLAINSYINEIHPILIGVDGGADALRELGYKPDIIIGDMDSISDTTLKCGAEIIVHAYPDGRAPGMERVNKLGLKAITFPAPGTSEDIAMLLAYEKGTEIIVAVGTHSNMIDFLEKGRKGMASTFLVRMKVGSILVDARGVNKLYKQPVKKRFLFAITAAALIPFILVMTISPPTRQVLQLIWMKFRVMLRL